MYSSEFYPAITPTKENVDKINAALEARGFSEDCGEWSVFAGAWLDKCQNSIKVCVSARDMGDVYAYYNQQIKPIVMAAVEEA